MIEKHYAAHLKNTIDASAINVMRPKVARTMEKATTNGSRRTDGKLGKPSRPQWPGHQKNAREAERVPSADIVLGDLTAET